MCSTPRKKQPILEDPEHIFALQLLNLLGLGHDNIEWIISQQTNIYTFRIKSR